MAEVVIDRLGRQGDGVGKHKGRDIYVPYTLPQDVVDPGTGNMVSFSDRKGDRQEPICTHFTQCGGCQMQHASDEIYDNWKLELVCAPLRKAGIEILPAKLVSFQTASRRKAVFNITRSSEGTQLGFTKRASHEVISIGHCPVLVAEINTQLDQLNDLAASVPITKTGTRISVLATGHGLDISIEDARSPSDNERQILIKKAIDHGFNRLSLNNEILIETRKPEFEIDGVLAYPHPGAFVQAVKDAESLMVNLVTEHLKKCKKTVDLFCGIGTFALPLAKTSQVYALEENAAAIESLNHSWRKTGGGLKQITAEARNLDRRPVTFSELKKFDGLVFDPPRSGAELQCKQIAKSKVSKVVAVSCNPVSLARDLEILTAGGFRVEKIIAIDQFKFTPHVEVVVLLEM